MMRAVRRDELHPVNLPRNPRSGAVEGSAIRSDEAEGAVIEHLDHDLALVQQPVMGAAQRDEIRKLGLAALRPVLYVMAVHEPCMRAARESAAVVAGSERAT